MLVQGTNCHHNVLAEFYFGIRLVGQGKVRLGLTDLRVDKDIGLRTVFAVVQMMPQKIMFNDIIQMTLIELMFINGRHLF